MSKKKKKKDRNIEFLEKHYNFIQNHKFMI